MDESIFEKYSLLEILEKENTSSRKTKIVCTIGFNKNH